MLFEGNKMDNIFDTIRFYAVATIGLFSTFTHINNFFKFALLVVSFAYTSYKLWKMIIEDVEKRNEAKKNNTKLKKD